MKSPRLAALAAVLATFSLSAHLPLNASGFAQVIPEVGGQAVAQAPVTSARGPAALAPAEELPSRISEKPLPAAKLPSAGRLYGGPYVTDVTPTSAVINWVVKTPGGSDWKVARSTLKGLKAGKTYYYDVLRDDTPEGRGQFATAPGKRVDFSFVIYGDTRTRNDVHRQVIQAIQKEKPAFVIHNGDLVNNGTQADLWPVFFGISEPLLRETGFFPMLGNHERNAPYFASFFPTAPLHYSFDWGGVHFSIINSDVVNTVPAADERAAFWNRMMAWLDADLARASSADFRIVAMHHTPFTAMKARQATASELAERLMPLLVKHRVSAVFSGHDHNYQHHRSQGIDFIVTGGGGAPLYDLDAPMPGVTVKTEKIEHYTRLAVKGRVCTMEAVTIDGRVIERIEMRAPAPAASTVGTW